MAKKLSDIDRNFAKPVVYNGLVYTEAKDHGRIEIDGLPYLEKNGDYIRMDKEVLENCSNVGVKQLGGCASGGMARFRTDSEWLGVKCRIVHHGYLPHFSVLGTAGMDVYIGSRPEKKYVFSIPPDMASLEYERTMPLGPGIKEITINMPTYAEVHSLMIGVEKKAEITEPTPFSVEKPICFYGSSITQGGCASRPGNAYTNMVGRKIDAEVYNLGFSGSAYGEQFMAEYIARLDISAFIMDYDHNTPSVENLVNTHYPFYKTVRAAHPDIPILMLSKPDYAGDGTQDEVRRSIIKDSYIKGIGEKDENLWFIDGETFFGTEDRDACTCDGCHPNDLGFLRMTNTVVPVLERAFKKAGK